MTKSAPKTFSSFSLLIMNYCSLPSEIAAPYRQTLTHESSIFARVCVYSNRSGAHTAISSCQRLKSPNKKVPQAPVRLRRGSKHPESRVVCARRSRCQLKHTKENLGLGLRKRAAPVLRSPAIHQRSQTSTRSVSESADSNDSGQSGGGFVPREDEQRRLQ